MTQTGCFRSDVPRQIETETQHARTREQDRIVKSEILHLGFARRSKEHNKATKISVLIIISFSNFDMLEKTGKETAFENNCSQINMNYVI